MKVLSIDGGGYLGLSTASFLAETERYFNTTCHEQFDLFCGTSTGAIIALALASGMEAEKVLELYEEFGPRIFNNRFPLQRFFRSFKGTFTTIYDNKELKASLDRVFRDMTLGDILKKNKNVLIPSFCITTGKPRIFKTDHAEELTAHNEYKLSDIALASSAVPIYLPVHRINSPTSGECEEFCDGGLFANHPAILGYTEAVSHLRKTPSEIKILSVSTPRADLAEYETTKGFIKRYMLRRGFLVWRMKVINIITDSTSYINDQVLSRLSSSTGFTYARIDLQLPPGAAMDIANPKATKALKQVGHNKAQNRENQEKLKEFFVTS